MFVGDAAVVDAFVGDAFVDDAGIVGPVGNNAMTVLTTTN